MSNLSLFILIYAIFVQEHLVKDIHTGFVLIWTFKILWLSMTFFITFSKVSINGCSHFSLKMHLY